MTEVHVLAIDLAKRRVQVCGTARGGAVLFNRTVSRSKLEQLLRGQPPCIVAMEACATSHYWGRMAQGFGHEVRLIPPIYVKPFVKRQKNDAADAAAIAEAALRPNMICVTVKSAENQARAVAFRTHQSANPIDQLAARPSGRVWDCRRQGARQSEKPHGNDGRCDTRFARDGAGHGPPLSRTDRIDHEEGRRADVAPSQCGA